MPLKTVGSLLGCSVPRQGEYGPIYLPTVGFWKKIALNQIPVLFDPFLDRADPCAVFGGEIYASLLAGILFMHSAWSPVSFCERSVYLSEAVFYFVSPALKNIITDPAFPLGTSRVLDVYF